MVSVRRDEVETDRTEALRETVRRAFADSTALRIVGGDTQRGWLPEDARCRDAQPLPVAGHRGIVHFAPTELVLTARCGTPLAEIDALLAEAGQMLPFDPPRFGPGATFGGAVAGGLAGPARPFHGAVRDAVLGVRLLDGRGEVGRFGGEVMKNVAGYDVSRLVTGARGTLGVILEASVRVRPRPELETSRVLELGLADALRTMTALQRRPLPLTGIAWLEGRLHLRLAGTARGVEAAARELGGEALAADADFWRRLRDLRLPFFAEEGALWRLSLPATAPQPTLPANWLLDWGGAQRWCQTDAEPPQVFEAARAAGGHAMQLRPALQRAPVAIGLRLLGERVRRAMDPRSILNPGALLPELAPEHAQQREA